MNRATLIILLASVLALPLAGCGSVGDALDPTEWFAGASDLFNTKKKLPGDRKPVFPEGVPGVSQGIPPDLMKGNQPQPENTGATPATRPATATPATRQATAAPEEFTPAPREKAKAKVKAKPKPAVTEERPPTTVTVRRAPQQQPQEQQQPQQQQQPTVDSLWPDPPPPSRTTTQPGAMQWPDPPPMR